MKTKKLARIIFQDFETKPRKPNIKFEKENRQKPLIQFQLFIFYETRLFTEKFSWTGTIHPSIFCGWALIHLGIFGGQALWAAPRDQFKPIRIGENLVVNYNGS